MTWRKDTYKPDYRSLPYESVHKHRPLYIPTCEQLKRDISEWKSPLVSALLPAGDSASCVLARPIFSDIDRRTEPSIEEREFSYDYLLYVGDLVVFSGIERPLIDPMGDVRDTALTTFSKTHKVAVTDDPDNVMFLHALGMIEGLSASDVLLCLPRFFADQALYENCDVIYDEDAPHMNDLLVKRRTLIGNNYEWVGALPSHVDSMIVAACIADNMKDVFASNCCVLDDGATCSSGERLMMIYSENELACANALASVLLADYADLLNQYWAMPLITSTREKGTEDRLYSLNAMSWHAHLMEHHLPSACEYEHHPVVQLAYDVASVIMAAARKESTCMRLICERPSHMFDGAMPDRAAISDLRQPLVDIPIKEVYKNVYSKARNLFCDCNAQSYLDALRRGIPARDLRLDVDWTRNR